MEKRTITNTGKILLTIWNVGLFVAVWCGYYNQFAFQTFRLYGGAVSLFIYIVMYLFLTNLYKAYRIASSSISESVFSQILSFGIADAVLYVEACLSYNRYINILPGIGTAVLQILGTILIVLSVKGVILRVVKPKKTMIVYGKNIELSEVEQFVDRISYKYSHLFDMRMIIREDHAGVLERAKDFQTILLYELSSEERGKLSDFCLKHYKELYLTPTLQDIMLTGCETKHLLDTPLLKYSYTDKAPSGYVLKRMVDIVLSVVLLIVTSPFMLVTAIAIKLEDGGPIFYTQKRCTKDAKEFDILKFRSMRVDAEKDGVIPCREHDDRITRVGAITRKTRIDELPQLLNILKGDMSFVGPRPERIEHVEQYTKELPEFANRMRVKGGLTGYAQIYGKYNTSAYDKLRLDMMYIENQSFLLDMKIILLTIRTVFQSESTEGFEKEKSNKMNQDAKKIVHVQMDECRILK